jgi:hypothetical protein
LEKDNPVQFGKFVSFSLHSLWLISTLRGLGVSLIQIQPFTSQFNYSTEEKKFHPHNASAWIASGWRSRLDLGIAKKQLEHSSWFFWRLAALLARH